MKGYKEYLFVDDGVGCSGKMVVHGGGEGGVDV